MRWHVDKLATNQTISRTSYTSVLLIDSLEFKNAKIHQVIFTLSSKKVFFDVLVDGISVFSTPFNLEEIAAQNQYGLSGQNSLEAGSFLSEYATNKFVFTPNQTLRFDTSFQIKMKSNHNSQQYILELGFIEWGES